ncbi:MAG TPA: DUF934 domain-containing protein [Burkholderiales bacterium]|nr:DUF934 domain-containing protein [Burkholderiales bacterium]
MATLIKERRIASDNWRLIKAGADGALPEIPGDGDIIVPLALWQRERAALLARKGGLAVWLDSHEDPAAIADDLKHLALVAVNFPKFGDGRGYSTARLLRERYGWKGELRAIGEVVRDHLFAMAAVGFDAFLLRDDQDPREALTAFHDFGESYQTSAAQPQPLFRRRLAGAK